MQLNPKAAQAYNERANTIFTHLTARPSQRPRVSIRRFVPDTHVTATIPSQDIIGEIKLMRRDREGNEAGKGFHHEGQTVELIGEGYQILKKIAIGMHKAPDLHISVSVAFLIDHIFEWVKKNYRRETTLSMTEYVLMECERSIKEYEVWIPIASTHVESGFNFGKMKIKTITREMLDQWEAESRQRHPELPPEADEFFTRWRKKILGLAAATMELKAEPKRGLAGGVREAFARGIVLVAAAGNRGLRSRPVYPAALDEVIAVSAMSDDGSFYPPGNRGEYIDVAAPGVEILSTLPGDAFRRADGTSYAAAHVTGVVALLLGKRPKAPPKRIQDVLEATSTDLGASGKDIIFGSGLVDACKSLEALVGGGGLCR